MRWAIRTATIEDAPSMIEMLNPIITAGIYTSITATISLAQQTVFLRDFPPDGVLFVAASLDTERVLGLQDVVPEAGYMGAISTFVALDAHRHGIGRALCEATFEAASARFRRLRATVRADNPGALAFYRCHGFNEVGVGDGGARVFLERPIRPRG